jgi:hypothetical protein
MGRKGCWVELTQSGGVGVDVAVGEGQHLGRCFPFSVFSFSRFLFSRIIRTSAYQSDISCLVSLKTSKLVQAQKNKADKTGRLV